MSPLSNCSVNSMLSFSWRNCIYCMVSKWSLLLLYYGKCSLKFFSAAGIENCFPESSTWLCPLTAQSLCLSFSSKNRANHGLAGNLSHCPFSCIMTKKLSQVNVVRKEDWTGWTMQADNELLLDCHATMSNMWKSVHGKSFSVS